MSSLIDSHCHLDYLQRDGRDLGQVVADAGRAGVAGMVTICTRLSEFAGVLAIAESYDNVWCSLGVHPHEAANEAAQEPGVTVERLLDLAAHAKVVGIGETGLDYHYEHSPREIQQELFRAHITVARETGLPLIVHSRDADADTLAILRDEHEKGPFPGLIHCFSAGKELGQGALDLGLYISISGIVTFKNAGTLRAVVADMPVERLLVETDAPYLAPIPKRGKQNEPAFVVHTAQALADLLALTADELAEATSANFHRLFSRVPADLSTAVTAPAAASP